MLSFQATSGSGYFEVQILSLTNNRGTLVDGRCCGGGNGGGGNQPPCTKPCSTAFWLCLKEYQSNVTAIGSCSFGNESSHALGQNTFTLNEPVTIQLHFTFRWTVRQTSILITPTNKNPTTCISIPSTCSTALFAREISSSIIKKKQKNPCRTFLPNVSAFFRVIVFLKSS